MNFDAVEMNRDLRRERKLQPLDWFGWTTLLALVAFSLYMYLWQFANQNSDLYKHAVIASEFNFADLHSITSRLAYPLWHLMVSALYQLGVPLGWAAAGICALCKGLTFWLVYRYISLMVNRPISRAVLTLCTLMILMVTPIRVPGVNDHVYWGIGSSTVWHNPTQLVVLVTAMLCVPYLTHCWYTFERLLPTKGERAMIPWRKVATLAVLMLLSLSTKPTFMQALIPAAAMFFLIQWIRHPRNSRFFGQIIVAFMPAVAYFVLQYLYYTGVVVPYTSGVEFGTSLADIWSAIRSLAMMAAFPLFALACGYRRDLWKDQAIVLSLWMALFSMLEAMFFRETGLRVNHGNFNWASMSAAFMLWVTVLPVFLNSIGQFREDRLRLQTAAREGTMPSEVLSRSFASLRTRSLKYLAAFMLLIWHVYSGVYYVYYLLSTGNSF